MMQIKHGQPFLASMNAKAPSTVDADMSKACNLTICLSLFLDIKDTLKRIEILRGEGPRTRALHAFYPLVELVLFANQIREIATSHVDMIISTCLELVVEATLFTHELNRVQLKNFTKEQVTAVNIKLYNQANQKNFHES